MGRYSNKQAIINEDEEKLGGILLDKNEIKLTNEDSKNPLHMANIPTYMEAVKDILHISIP